MAERLSALSTMAFAGHRLAQQSLQNGHFGGNASQFANGKNDFSAPNINPALSLGLGGDAASAAALALSSLPSQALPSTPEELAIVNQFLVRLGEQIAAGNVAANQGSDMHHHGSAAGAGYGLGPTGSLSAASNPLHLPVQQHLVGGTPGANYFDANTLAALGIANVPGLHPTYQQALAAAGGAAYAREAVTAASLSALINAAGAGGLGAGANHAGLYGQAAALAGLTPQHPANAASHGLPSGLASLFTAQRHHPSLSLTGSNGHQAAQTNAFASAGAGERKASADLANLYPFGFLSSNSPGRSSSSGSSDMDGATLARGASSGAGSSPDIQNATATTNQLLASLTAANAGSNVDGTAMVPKSPGQLSLSSGSGSSIGNGGTSPMPAFATTSSDLFAGVPTTKDVRHGQSVAPQISNAGDGPGVRKQMVLLKAARPTTVVKEEPADDEEVDELEDDDVDGDAVMQSRSPSPTPTDSTVHSQYPMRTLQPIQPSEKTSYPSLFSSRSSPPPANPTSVTLPSAASLISQADEIASRSRRSSSTRYSSEETEGSRTPSARYPSLGPSTPGKRPSSSGAETVLPGIASLALDLPVRRGATPPAPAAESKGTEERVKHLAIIEALLQWVNSEYVKRHGDPWVAAEKKAKEEKEKEQQKEQRVGMLRAASLSPPSIMKDEEDSDEESEASDDSFESEDELSVAPSQASQPVHRMMDVEMVA